MSNAFLETITTDRKFEALGLGFIDQTILTIVTRNSKAAFTSVTYIAQLLGMSREAVSRRLSALVKKGFISRLDYNARKVFYTLTQKARDTISQFKQKIEQDKRDRIRKKNEAIREAKRQKAEAAAARKEAVEADQESTEETDLYSQKERDKMRREFEHSELPPEKLGFVLDDYFNYCQRGGKIPGKMGFSTRLDSETYKYQRSLKARAKAEQLNQAKDRYDAARVAKIHKSANAMEGSREQKTTEDRLTAVDWAEGLE